MTVELGTAQLLEQLESDGRLLLTSAESIDRDERAVGLEWTVREVVVHTGAVHRWAADIVRRALPTNETGGSRAFHPDPDDGDLLDWFRAGHTELLTALREADDDLEAWTFGRGAPAKWFWTRRQAHETAIHRVDVEAVAGPVTDFPAEFAQDGIDELAAGFARNRAFAVSEAGTLRLAASDGPSWLIRFGGERIEATRDEQSGDATVTGTSSDLYRWLWNRPSPASVSGAEHVASLWRRVTIT